MATLQLTPQNLANKELALPLTPVQRPAKKGDPPLPSPGVVQVTSCWELQKFREGAAEM